MTTTANKRPRRRPVPAEKAEPKQRPREQQQRRPRHYNLREAAWELGIGYDVLYGYAASHEVYKPAAVRKRINIYTDEQLDIISLVLRKKLTENQGLQLWRETENKQLKTVLLRARRDDMAKGKA